MYTKRQKVNIDDTRFIFTTNFSGDPSRDRFGSDKRRVNVVIPTMDLVNHLMDLGVKVRQSNLLRACDDQHGLQVAPAYLLGHHFWQAPALQHGHDQSAGLYPGQERLSPGKPCREAERTRRVQPVCGCDVC